MYRLDGEIIKSEFKRAPVPGIVGHGQTIVIPITRSQLERGLKIEAEYGSVRGVQTKTIEFWPDYIRAFLADAKPHIEAWAQ